MSLKNRHPGVILLFFVTVLVVTMSTRHPAVAFLSFALAFLLRIRLAGPREAGKSLLFLIPMIVMMLVFNSLFNDRGMTLLFAVGRWSVTLESVFYGFVSGLVLSAVMLWFQSYNDMMDSGRFLALLGGRLPVISMMVSMIFRFIPETMAHGREIEMSRRALLGNPRRRFNLTDGIRMLTVLMAWSMENAIETADAMRAKAFDAGSRRAYGRIRRVADDLPPLVLTLLFFATSVAGWLAGGSAFLYYPFLTIPDRVRTGSSLALWLVGSTALFAIPFLTDAVSAAADRIRVVRRRAADRDPFVTAMLPEFRAGDPR